MLASRRKALGAAGAAGVALALVATPAFADYGPQAGDVVGVGSDTVQNIGNFLTDGSGGLSGYNNAGNKNRFVSFDATADANDRAVYANAGTTPLKTTIILRAGTNPVQRPNGSGAGIAALLADTGATPKINFVRMSRLPKTTEQSQAVTNGWGGLNVYKVAKDDLVMAGKKASLGGNAVAVSATDLVAIYQCTKTTWNQVGGTSTATIIPEIPQSGSGTGDTFRADLQTINGGTAVTLGSCVQTVEENDPNSLTDPNAYAPFSDGRKKLFDNGYFHDPNTAYPGGAALTSNIDLLYGAQTPEACTPPTSGASLTYCDTRGLYFVIRHTDLASATPFQPGGAKNFANTLFDDTSGTPYVKSPAGQSLIASAGVNATYVNCGFGTGVTSC